MLRRFFGLICAAVTLVVGLAVLGRLPERVPIHWNALGEVDGYASPRMAVLLIPAMMLVLWAVLTLVVSAAVRSLSEAGAGAVWFCVNTTYPYLALVQFGVLASALGWPLSVPRLIAAAIGVMFAAIGIALPRLPRNSVAGIRVPPTLRDDRVWHTTHRIAGRMFIAAGVVSVVGALALPEPWPLVVLLGSILGAIVASIVEAYRTAATMRPTNV
jgi:uncharacterized membrane protein